MGGFRLRICSFKRTSTKKVLSGSWTPFKPEYYPFADVEELCNPCFRWRFLELLRGNIPRWGSLLKDPFDPNQDFPRYFKVAQRFREFAVVLMRAIARSPYPDSILRSIRQPGLLLESIRGNAELEDFDIRAMNLVGSWLERLNDEGILFQYQSSENALFNLQVLNEEFNIYKQDQTRVSLTERRDSAIGRNQQTTPNTFSWRGQLAIYGTIPILNLEKKEIRVPVPLVGNFFNPALDLSDEMNTPEGIRLFFIIKEYHKMWILRESFAQLIEENKLPLNIYDEMDNVLFTSNYDLNAYNLREFDIIVDTIDHSFTMDHKRSFKTETGHAAIIFDLLHRNYPGIANSFQDMNPCPIQIGQDPDRPYFCPMGWNQGCGMKDRRIKNLQFPRDRVETNIYRFLRYLRDEAIFSHEVLFKLTRLYPSRLFELNQFSNFWIGGLYQDSLQRLIFHPVMPEHWNLPDITEKIYEVCLISPFCYEKGCKVIFDSILNNNEYVIKLFPSMNPWYQDHPFNLARNDNRIQCIIGEFSIDENLFNIKRQKRQLVRAIQYSRRSLNENDEIARQTEILGNRLEQRFRRIGLATFGRFARYV